MSLPRNLHNKLNERRNNNSLRHLSIKKDLIDFSSNDYLGLSSNKELASIIEEKIKSLALGATGSRLLSGNNKFTENAERQLAKLFHAEAALIFNSGYAANLAVLSSLPQRGDFVLYDELCHASIKDGIRLGFATKRGFKHNDLSDLALKLKNVKSGTSYIVIESIYSMDGDVAPLLEISALCAQYDAYLIIDEAHATGIYGDNGSGICQQLGIANKVFCRILTYGKAMGSHGAVVLGGELLKQFLINYARPLIYTTALPPASYVIMTQTAKFLSKASDIKSQLFNNIILYKSLFDKYLSHKYKQTNSNHAIQTIIVPGNEHVKNLSVKLAQHGFDVPPILSPTVKSGEERLRICLHSYNTNDEIKLLITSLADL